MTNVAPSTFLVKNAYRECEKIARSHYENFSIGTLMLPRSIKPDLFAIYAFCRKTDDIGDAAKGDRLKALDSWEHQVLDFKNTVSKDPILIALHETIKRFSIPIVPFLKLIQANRMDQQYVRFQTFKDLEYYCDHSANSVGEMVLHLTESYSEENLLLSNYTCTALQLTNFLQDVKRDLLMDRIYLPLEDMTRFQYAEEDLKNSVLNNHFRELMAFEISRARLLFESGYGLVERISGKFKLDIALFSKGGLRILESIENQSFDVFSKRPTISSREKFQLFVTSLLKMLSRRRP